MPVTVTLSTVPGKLTCERGYTSKTIELFGPSLAMEAGVPASAVPDIAAGVERFGARVRAEHHRLRFPGGMSAKLIGGASFYVLVRLAKGHRKPNGFDAASKHNGFGQDDFLHVEEQRTKPDTPADAPASLVAPTTPEQAVVNGGAA